MFNIMDKRWVSVVGLIILTAMLLSIVFTGAALAQGPSPQSPGQNWGQRGMMGWGYNSQPSNPYGYSQDGQWTGPMREYGWGPMGPGMGYGRGYRAPAPGLNNTAPYYGYGWDDCLYDPYDW